MTVLTDGRRRRKTRRIYYGPPGDQTLYWEPKVKMATKSVTINGKLEYALAGVKGSTIGCHLSNCAMDNTKVFGHPCKLAVFTRKTCLIVTEFKNGKAAEAIEYYHPYSNMVMLNDTDGFKKYIKANPHLANRPFTLTPPHKVREPGRKGGANKTATTGEKRAFAHRGSMERAASAGLINPALVKMLAKNSHSAPDPNTPALKMARRALGLIKRA